MTQYPADSNCTSFVLYVHSESPRLTPRKWTTIRCDYPLKTYAPVPTAKPSSCEHDYFPDIYPLWCLLSTSAVIRISTFKSVRCFGSETFVIRYASLYNVKQAQKTQGSYPNGSKISPFIKNTLSRMYQLMAICKGNWLLVTRTR